MTPEQVIQWLGVSADYELPENVLSAMKDVPWPETGSDEINAFSAYLKACKMPVGEVIQSEVVPDEVLPEIPGTDPLSANATAAHPDVQRKRRGGTRA